MSKVKPKDHRPGIRIPTAKGSIRHKSKKDYNRGNHRWVNGIEYEWIEDGDLGSKWVRKKTDV
jgi:hypothetical protein